MNGGGGLFSGQGKVSYVKMISSGIVQYNMVLWYILIQYIMGMKQFGTAANCYFYKCNLIII